MKPYDKFIINANQGKGGFVSITNRSQLVLRLADNTVWAVIEGQKDSIEIYGCFHSLTMSNSEFRS